MKQELVFLPIFFFEQFARPVGGAVVDNDDLFVEFGLLDAIEDYLDCGYLVVDGDDD